jgi:hypothetical protein
MKEMKENKPALKTATLNFEKGLQCSN